MLSPSCSKPEVPVPTLLLDTHVALWLVADHHGLGPLTKAAVANVDNELIAEAQRRSATLVTVDSWVRQYDVRTLTADT